MKIATNELPSAIEPLKPLHFAGMAGRNPGCKALAGFDAGASSFGGNPRNSCQVETSLPDLLLNPFAVCTSDYHLSRN